MNRLIDIEGIIQMLEATYTFKYFAQLGLKLAVK